MFRKLTLGALLSLILFATDVTHADSHAIDTKIVNIVDDYFNTIQTIAADFIQISDGEETGSGKFYINRVEQKMKWEYTSPSPIDIIFNKDKVIYFDKQLDEVSRTSLEDSLLTLLTSHHKLLHSPSIIIKNTSKFKDRYEITIYNPNNNEEPELTLILSKNPLYLKSIRTRDKDQRVNDIKFNNAVYNSKIDNKVFQLDREFLKKR